MKSHNFIISSETGLVKLFKNVLVNGGQWVYNNFVLYFFYYNILMSAFAFITICSHNQFLKIMYALL